MSDYIPGVTEVEDEHEHDSSPWDKHRGRFARRPLNLFGRSIAGWAKAITDQDIRRIHSAISVGLTAGEDNTDIAHRVIGSRRFNGSNGVTEVTRKHIQRLGLGLLERRKPAWAGAQPDGPDELDGD